MRLNENFKASYNLSNFSKLCMSELPIRPELYRKTAKGTLSLFPSLKQRDGALTYIQSTLETLRLQAFDAQNCIEKVPLLGHCVESRRPKAGIFSDEDFSGDIRSFTECLSKECEREGVSFIFGVGVSDVKIENNVVQTICLDNGGKIESPDVVVVCAGNATPKIASDLGDTLLQIPVLGYGTCFVVYLSHFFITLAYSPTYSLTHTHTHTQLWKFRLRPVLRLVSWMMQTKYMQHL